MIAERGGRAKRSLRNNKFISNEYHFDGIIVNDYFTGLRHYCKYLKLIRECPKI